MAIKKPEIVRRPRGIKFVKMTGAPDNTIDLNGLIRYCKENMIPLANLPEELVNKFRTE